MLALDCCSQVDATADDHTIACSILLCLQFSLTRVHRASSLNTDDSWLYEDGHDEIVLSVDQPCQLLGVGLCGTEGAYTAELELLEVHLQAAPNNLHPERKQMWCFEMLCNCSTPPCKHIAYCSCGSSCLMVHAHSSLLLPRRSLLYDGLAQLLQIACSAV